MVKKYKNSLIYWLALINNWTNSVNRIKTFVCQQSQGILETLSRYIDTDSSHSYTAEDLEKLLKQVQHQRVKLISDAAQMGKSTVLTHLSKQIQQTFTASWVVRIDLNDHTEALKSLKENRSIRRKRLNFFR